MSRKRFALPVAMIVAVGLALAMPAAATFTSALHPSSGFSATSVNPKPVTNLQAQACVALSLTSTALTWTASTSPDLSGYDVYRGATKLTSSPLAASATSYTDSLSLTLGGSYTYKVRAYAGSAMVWYADKSVTVQIPLVIGCNTATTP
jgi:hypothetical protein